jgi:hypothetical protein
MKFSVRTYRSLFHVWKLYRYFSRVCKLNRHLLAVSKLYTTRYLFLVFNVNLIIRRFLLSDRYFLQFRTDYRGFTSYLITNHFILSTCFDVLKFCLLRTEISLFLAALMVNNSCFSKQHLRFDRLQRGDVCLVRYKLNFYVPLSRESGFKGPIYSHFIVSTIAEEFNSSNDDNLNSLNSRLRAELTKWDA